MQIELEITVRDETFNTVAHIECAVSTHVKGHVFSPSFIETIGHECVEDVREQMKKLQEPRRTIDAILKEGLEAGK